MIGTRVARVQTGCWWRTCASPFTRTSQSMSGASRAIAFLAREFAAIRRLGLAGDAAYPDREQWAIVCSRVPPETVGTLRLLMASGLATGSPGQWLVHWLP